MRAQAGPYVEMTMTIARGARIALCACTALAGTSIATVRTADAGPCTVNVIAAPDEVRAQIESWVQAEPSCARELRVRVAVTEDGYELTAFDDGGQVRTRVVPDAPSAAVLVVSWMADDSVPASAEPTIAFDSDSPFSDELSLHARPAATRRPRHWLALGTDLTAQDQVGVRGQIDVLAGAHWMTGVAAGWLQAPALPNHGLGPGMPSGSPGAIYKAAAFGGVRGELGPVLLRAQLGLGVDVETRNSEMPTTSSLVPVLTSEAFAGVRIHDSWAAIAGPLAEVPLSGGGPIQLGAFVGLEFGL
jgi:hypothetical protein